MAGILGCLVRFNKELMRDTDIPYSFECSLDDMHVNDYSDVVQVASLASEKLSALLGIELRLGEPRWEYIGRRFNLYAYPLYSKEHGIGELRVVETGGHVLIVAGAFTTLLERYLDEEITVTLREEHVLSTGSNIPITLLEPSSGASKAPGQVTIPSFVIHAVEGIQQLSIEKWRLTIRGAVAAAARLAYNDLLELVEPLETSEFHCVAGWSTRLRDWRGVPLSKLLERTGLRRGAEWLAARNSAGYASIVPLDLALREGFIITHIGSKPLSPEQGYPARLFFPSLYGWKAAKWITELIVLDHYEDGYWETLAYHERGLVSAEERFKIRNKAIASRRRLPSGARKMPPQSR